MDIFDPIVKELFNRSRAGVFAARDAEDNVLIDSKSGAIWCLNLGLAARLQHAAVQPVADHPRNRHVRTVDDLIKPYPPLESDGYELAGTDHLLAQLYRLGVEHEWVLGLWRPGKFRGHLRGHWSGLCWSGGPARCAGLASFLVADIAQRVLQGRDRQRREDEGLPEDLTALFDAALANATMPKPSRTYIAGIAQFAAIRATTSAPGAPERSPGSPGSGVAGASGDGDSGGGGESDDPGNDLADFVRLD